MNARLIMQFLCAMSAISLIIFPMLFQGNAFAHFFGGTTVNVDRYQVTFVPFPEIPTAGNNSTTRLNFSVLENNSNINNIYSALIIKKDSGEEVAQIPYKFYEFSDITIPFVFSEPGTYIITLDSRIIGDQKFQATPLEATFDIVVTGPIQSIVSDRVTLAIIVVASTIGIGSLVFIRVWKKK